MLRPPTGSDRLLRIIRECRAGNIGRPTHSPLGIAITQRFRA